MLPTATRLLSPRALRSFPAVVKQPRHLVFLPLEREKKAKAAAAAAVTSAMDAAAASSDLTLGGGGGGGGVGGSTGNAGGDGGASASAGVTMLKPRKRVAGKPSTAGDEPPAPGPSAVSGMAPAANLAGASLAATTDASEGGGGGGGSGSGGGSSGGVRDAAASSSPKRRAVLLPVGAGEAGPAAAPSVGESDRT